MPSIQEWYNQHKSAVFVGAGITGLVVFIIVSRQNTSSTSNKATLDTLHSDLEGIDKRLSQENSYLSSSASMSPLSPEIDISETMAPGNTTVNTPAAPKAPSPASSSGKHPKPPVKKKSGSGPGDYETSYASPGSFGFGGDANDYWGLN